MALFNVASKIATNIFRSAGSLITRLSSTNVALQHSEAESKNVIEEVNRLSEANISRSFAIVHLLGKQFKVTDGDVIILEGYWPPKLGDELKLEKVLLAGTNDFSLIGRPLVQPGVVKVIATVIGKELSYTKTRFRKKKRKQFMRINFIKKEQTYLRINEVKIGANLNKSNVVSLN